MTFLLGVLAVVGALAIAAAITSLRVVKEYEPGCGLSIRVRDHRGTISWPVSTTGAGGVLPLRRSDLPDGLPAVPSAITSVGAILDRKTR